MLGASEASKKGLSAGWLAGEALMGDRTVGERRVGGVAVALRFEEAVVFGEAGESVGSARGEETLGACLLDVLPSRETGKRPLPLLLPATVIWLALPYEALLLTDPVAERSVWPGIIIWTGLPLAAGVLAANSVADAVVSPAAEPGVSEFGEWVEADLTETIRGAARTTCCAGMGSTLLV